jgi:demethoxyubiquinone hydroxylase (CLK1/Coq7/Cat5 family)
VTQYTITIRYRTNSGCNAKSVTLEASTVEEAFELATAKVRRQRGVIRIDGGEWCASTAWKGDDQ